MKIQRHGNGQPRVAEWTTLAELLAIPFVADWREDPGFDHYAFCLVIDRWILMAILDEGKRWYVLGYLDQLPQEDGLIMWTPPE